MAEQKMLISIVSPCYNEEDNVVELYKRLSNVIIEYPKYDFEFIFIDNASTDNTVNKLKEIAAKNRHVKIIVNNRNFGHIRSPYWGVIQSHGDATIYLASDLQDPPEVIPRFIEEWENGYKVVMATKPVSQTNFITHRMRRAYYSFLDGISDVSQIKDATGFGLYDKSVLDKIREIDDPYPYFRGLIAEFGYEVKTIPFDQTRRLRGVSKNNFYTLYDMAMLGIVNHSLVPIRIASFMGFLMGGASILTALVFFILKLIYWDQFSAGIAPIVIGLFFMFGILLFFIGLLGEYIAAIHTHVKKRPIVVEKERINF